jgi:hypothetical protein
LFVVLMSEGLHTAVLVEMLRDPLPDEDTNNYCRTVTYFAKLRIAQKLNSTLNQKKCSQKRNNLLS